MARFRNTVGNICSSKQGGVVEKAWTNNLALSRVVERRRPG
jgi:hypothetical protein